MVAIGNGAAAGAGIVPQGATPGLFLLFEKGKRPTRAGILGVIAGLASVHVSHDPASVATAEREDDWLELLVDGFTFDLNGLHPGTARSLPAIEHHLGVSPHFDHGTMEAIRLIPGPHIAGGARTLPVLRVLVSLGRTLADALPDVQALCWPPARLAISPPHYSRLVAGWMAGGPFPALALTGFRIGDDGALRSEGLAFLTGQEVELAPDLSEDRVAATRHAVRIIHELVTAEPLREAVEVIGEDNLRLKLDPQAGGKVIRITPI